MTHPEFIATCSAIAAKYGVALVDLSREGVASLEYLKNGNYIGGWSLIGSVEYITTKDIAEIEAQIKYLSRRKRA